MPEISELPPGSSIGGADLFAATQGFSTPGTGTTRRVTGAMIRAFITANMPTILDGALGAVQGSIAYRDATGWAGLPPGTAGHLLATGGPNANPDWVAGAGGVVYGTTAGTATEGNDARLIAAQTIENRFVFPGPISDAGVSPIVAQYIGVAQTIPADFAGTGAAAMTAGTSSNLFTIGYRRAGSNTAIGTLTFAADGTVTLSTQAAFSLAVGDLLYMIGPATPDVSLADFAATVLTTRN